MVVLGGRAISYEGGTPVAQVELTASERRGNTFKRLMDFCQKDNARIWPSLSHVSYSLDSDYRGTWLKRNRLPLGPYKRPVPSALYWSRAGRGFRMSDVPQH